MKKIFTLVLLMAAMFFSTLATAQTVVLEETFDEIVNGTNTSNPKWNLSVKWTGNTNCVNVVDVWEADKAIFLGDKSDNRIGSFDLKELDLSGNGGAFTVTVVLKGNSPSKTGNIKVLISGNDASAKDHVPTTYRDGEWETVSFDFTGGTSNTVLRFESVMGVGNGKGLFIDNIQVTQAAGEPNLVCGQDAVEFGRTNLNETAKSTLLVVGTNLTGDIETAITGDDAAAFSVAQREGANENLTLTLAFTPTKAGKNTANLQLSAGDLTLDIALSGMGVDPANPYGFNPDATPVESLLEPFTNEGLPEGWNNIAFEGEVKWERKAPYLEEPLMVIEAAGSGQKVRSALITPLIKVVEGNYKVTLTADYRVGYALGAKVVVKRFAADGTLLGDLYTISPTEPTDRIASDFNKLLVEIPADGKNSYFVFEYIGDDSPEDAAARTTLTVHLDNVSVQSEPLPDPTLETDIPQITFGEVEKQQTLTKRIKVIAQEVTSRISAEVVGADAALFSLSTDALAATGGDLEVTIDTKNAESKENIDAKLRLSATGLRPDMTVTLEVPMIGSIVNRGGIEQIAAAQNAIRCAEHGIEVLRTAQIAIFDAKGQRLAEGMYSAGTILTPNYTGVVVIVVDGVAFKTVLR